MRSCLLNAAKPGTRQPSFSGVLLAIVELSLEGPGFWEMVRTLASFGQD